MNLEEYIRPYNKLLNIVLQKKFKWFEKIELDDLKYGGVRGQQNFINPVGKMYVNSTWAYKQWREYHYDTPFYYDEELNFGDIIGGDLSKEIQKQFKICFSQVVGEFIPKYMSFSWLTVVLVDKKEDTIKESIRRILREETELPLLIRRRVDIDELDDLVDDVRSLIDSGYDKTDAIYDTIRQFVASKRTFRFNDETEQQYWDSYVEVEKPLVKYVKSKLRHIE